MGLGMNFSKTKKQRSGTSISSSSSDEDVSLCASSEPLQKMAPARLHSELSQYKLTEVQRHENGYPYFDRKNVIFPPTATNQKDWVASDELHRKCSRCSTVFELNNDGTIPSQKCFYHHKSKYDHVTRRLRRTCCSAHPTTSSGGCMVEESHVFSAAWEDTLWDFVATPAAKSGNDYRSKKVYGLDCELIHTLNGMELARVSLVDVKGRVILDTFVLPQYQILSYNTAFSGVTEKDLEKAISFEACRLQLFQYINAETLLVGHSLESDLKALRLVHENVIDTSVLFRALDIYRGNWVKLSLQNLAKVYLQKDIQSHKTGHSSVEDSITCLELVAVRHVSAVK